MKQLQLGLASEVTCKDPNGAPTRKQTWAVFCMSGCDIRNADLTRQEVSNIITALKTKGECLLPNGKTFGDGEDFICTKAKLKETSDRLWQKEGKVNPLSVAAVVKHKNKTAASKPRWSWAEDLIQQAEEAGQRAMQALIDSKKVAPMIVAEHENMLDDNSPVKKSWVVEGGPCGFAAIRVKCSNGPSRKFIFQLKKKGLAGDENSFAEWRKSSYYGGFMKSFTLIGGQSLAYKEAYAYAYQEVLQNAGLDTWVWTRMD